MRLRCEVLERDGALPRVIRNDAGQVLRLYADSPPAHAQWLGLLDGVAVWAEAVAGPATPEAAPGGGEAAEVVWLETLALDEVGVAVGPDRGDGLGLFDSPITANTGEHTEGATAGPERVGEQRRTAVLAWIAAQAADLDVPAEPGAPCEALKRLVADEPLDPLPALDGVPRHLDTRVPARAPAPPEREDTVTQIEGFEARVEGLEDREATGVLVPPRHARAWWITAVVLGAAAALAWGLRALS